MSSKRYILHFITPLKNVSPFDVNMAVDAGFDVVVPYTRVEAKEVAGLVQDAIFSRAPKDGRRTAVLIGGRDPLLALDMLEAAKGAMVPPWFRISVLADPSGAFTTAAAMVAVVEKHLAAAEKQLAGRRVAVFGATGPVGAVAGLIAAEAGALVTLVGYDGRERVAKRAAELQERFGVVMDAADGSDEAGQEAILAEAEIVLAAGRAGVEILTGQQLRRAPNLLIALDVNAVPPAGLGGVASGDDGKPIAGSRAVAVGALAVGAVKVATEHALLQAMRDRDEPIYAGHAEAFSVAREHVG